jgi:hypothetical protein
MRRKDRQKALLSTKPIVAGVSISEQGLSLVKENTSYANQLYEKAKSLSQNLDEHTAKLIIESVDDAIKEFGTTNQDKKVELRRIKAEAEKILPPDTIESLRKRAEGDLLQKVYPKQRTFRRVLLFVIAITILVTPLVFGIKELIKSQPPPATLTETQKPDTEKPSQPSDVSTRLPDENQSKQIEQQTVTISPTLTPKYLSQYIKRARMLYEQGYYQSALIECDKALAVEPGNQEAIRLKKQIRKTLEVLK